MARTLQQRVADLRALGLAQPSAIPKLATALGSPTGLLVAAAAKLVEDHLLEALVPGAENGGPGERTPRSRSPCADHRRGLR